MGPILPPHDNSSDHMTNSYTLTCYHCQQYHSQYKPLADPEQVKGHQEQRYTTQTDPRGDYHGCPWSSGYAQLGAREPLVLGVVLYQLILCNKRGYNIIGQMSCDQQ